ncbi:IPT/TIG domain-containing protein [Quadrisphaera sp. KR29]|uniref:IPT/TIG domain-containing protein n=1 Tax=Quadrisphaera sp. KR29 TaxID=3461391 RepID=UPI00404407A1
MSKRTLALRVAAVAGATGITLGLSSLCSVAFAADAPSLPVLSRISVATGSQAGGTVVTLSGTDLSTSTPGEEDGDAPELSKPVVTFSVAATTKEGSPTTAVVDEDDVEVISTGVVRVVTPKILAAGKATITVKDGADTGTPGAKTPTFTFGAAVPTIADEGGVTAEKVTSEDGGSITVNGEFLGDAKTVKVLVGGKAATSITSDDGKKLVAVAPKGLTGYQDVVVTTKGGTVDAGVVGYTATTPKPTWSEDGYVVSTQKGATLNITGTDLQNVTGGTYTSASGTKTAVKVAQPTGKDDKGKGLKLGITLPAKLAAGDGTLVLSTPYATSEKVKVSVKEAKAPTLTGFAESSATQLKKAGGTVTLVGTNLNFISSVKLGSATLAVATGENPTTGYTVNDAATQITVYVPPQTAEVLPLLLNITSDGGAAKYTVPVTNSKLDAEGSYDATKKTFTLTGENLKNLNTWKVVDASNVAVATTFTVSTDGKSVVSKAFTTAPKDGVYTITAKDASASTFTSKVTVGASSTVASISGASYDAATRKVSVTGTKFDNTLTFALKNASGMDVEAGGAAFTGDSATARSLTLGEDYGLMSGEYTVTASKGGEVVSEKKFTVTSSAKVSGATSSASVEGEGEEAITTTTVTLTGTGLSGLNHVKVLDAEGVVVLELAAAGSGNTATTWAGSATGALTGGTEYTVDGWDVHGVDFEPVTFTAAS